MRTNLAYPVATFLLTAGLVTRALAADTTEPFDVGATDVELYGAFDGIGPAVGERAVAGELVAGFGILDRLSAYLGTCLAADGRLANGEAGLFLGLYGTPLDTDHLDLDFILGVSAGGPGFRDFALTPGLELNVDLDPEQRTWGAYLRLGIPVFGRPVAGEGSAAPSGEVEHETVVAIAINPGTYVTLVNGHQLLLEVDMALHPGAGEDDHVAEIGGVALGYNVQIAEPLELLTQVYLDVPQASERPAVGLMAGFIATLPSPARPRVASSESEEKGALVDGDEERGQQSASR